MGGHHRPGLAHRQRAAWGAGVALVLALLVAASALASNWDGPNDGNQGWAVAGGNPIEFTQCDLTATVHDFFHSNYDHDIEPTDIVPTGSHSCTTIDVGTGDDNFGSGALGFAECHDFVSPNTCNIAHAHIDLSHPPGSGEFHPDAEGRLPGGGARDRPASPGVVRG